jgi:hypothetical protein
MGNDSRRPSGSDHILLLCVDGGRELVHLHQNVRAFLSGIDNLAAAETILVAVLLVGDAFQVDDHQPFSSDSRPAGYRAGLPDRLASVRGLEPSAGGTRTWVEIAVAPSASRPAERKSTPGRGRLETSPPHQVW